MRPLVIHRESDELNLQDFNQEQLICQSDQVLGNGIISDIYDVVFVDYHLFNRAKSKVVANEVSYFNSKLLFEKRPYLLIGVGRWGTLDPWLGIPVDWEDIAGAKAIVETNMKEIPISPSQGSHFFQNISSFMIGYFTINLHDNKGYIDWDWLLSRDYLEKKDFTKHIRFEEPITIKINGHKNKGVIIKPGK